MYNWTNINKIMVGSQEYSKAYLGSELIWEGYTILTPEMIAGTIGSNYQRYIGTATSLIIDDSFPTNNLTHLFRDNQTLKSLVILTDKFTNMNNTFRGIGNQLESLDINTSNVTDMSWMFRDSQATTLDLSSFDTSSVTTMANMFSNSQASILDLSSFDTSNVTNVVRMFSGSQATTGYARTQADADRFNASSGKPSTLNFVVKEA